MKDRVRIMDGKATAALVRAEVAEDVARIVERGVRPGLAVVLVGDDPASEVYVRNKDRAATEAGIAVRTLRPEATISQPDLEALVRELGADGSVHGILVQLPLPAQLDPAGVVEAIDPRKDVDGLHPRNVAALAMDLPGLVPCTPAGCIELCDRYGIELAGRHAVVVGRSQLVGKPVAQLLLARNATVTICHSRTADLAGVVGTGDVIVAAVGRAGLIRGEWIRPGACVLDVGINRGADGKLCGDVEFGAASARAGAITPVPGGVGPMTIAMLLKNTARAAEAALDAVASPGRTTGAGI
ncbi:MAG: bifunctional 5,10-methylenetetrahydrofolate dehydrogenase/5,10-methenyltetrahydrofolate cyclohydrolase [Planctomycetota bacterium]|jgi:methylenetetrahydrofolate dehydrogenase (NADP+)/methenyltetrahydrofolate cyclohydrolase|nr:bifunctional 5,10-methylenetetrahydrofolate dehydrogenase/5,10-methenyltetrahydrofolate cyclohydrolase [Planctomycetota bacterium]MDP6762978.1 bifunctional 5,10-methylenetetrahydrofolate dehydrogenase/5,10-methenyltetrahydrofolate cyclohydrolase [Planctomycetota bacterium]MDP6987856.1 bifunctional 5,10-methylenetetrahydrofolate dehydrogenase/5,10-methenyltetrahydrofolate cyclohydrolase [Planctomycetota bacterium]